MTASPKAGHWKDAGKQTSLYILTYLLMPNWVYNEVEISAPITEVQEFLAPDFDMDDPKRPIHRFNLHRIFPERFDATDSL